MLILLPQVFILLLWAAVDTPIGVKTTIYLNHHPIITNRCQSKYTLKWISFHLFYFLLIITILIILALKSSKIRYKSFQDTKATNAYTFLAVFNTITALILWAIFHIVILSIEEEYYTLCISHAIGAFLCPTFLFLPKVYLPLKRHFYKNKVKTKIQVR